MRKVLIYILAALLLSIAILPWRIKGGNVNALVPNDLRQQPLYYDATVTAARVSTIEAGRSATSIIRAIPLGTVDIPAETQSLPTSIVRIVTVETDTPKTPTPTIPTPWLAEDAPPTPVGLIDTEDIITEEQLTEQLKTEPEGSQLRNLEVTLTETGFQIDGTLASFPVGGGKIEVHGGFLVKNYSLVVDISSIILNGTDVTLSYHEEVESRMDTSLYRMLPERYVQSFMLSDGQLLVVSKMRR